MARGRADQHGPAATAAPRDDQRRVPGTNHKTATAAATPASATLASPADRDLKGLARGQAEVAGNLGTSTAHAGCSTIGERTAVSALRPKGEDPIGVGGRHGKGNEAAGISEIERYGAGVGGYREQCDQRGPAQRELFHPVALYVSGSREALAHDASSKKRNIYRVHLRSHRGDATRLTLDHEDLWRGNS